MCLLNANRQNKLAALLWLVKGCAVAPVTANKCGWVNEWGNWSWAVLFHFPRSFPAACLLWSMLNLLQGA